MIRARDKSDWRFLRVVVPVFPRENIFTKIVTKLTCLGAIVIGTIADKVWGWRVEVVDENNFAKIEFCDARGLPDHAVLQKNDPADVVAFYCGLSCTVERVWELAEFYKSQGVITIAGAWHAKDNPEETLTHNIDVVFYSNEGDALREFLYCVRDGKSWKNTQGIYFLENGALKKNPAEKREVVRGYDRSLDNQPYSNFGLLRHAHKLEVFTIRRIIGCSEKCEFCRVCEIPRWASPQHLVKTVDYLVEKFGAKRFFRADDNSGEDRAGELEFWRLIKEKYGNRLKFGVQVRVDIADDDELIQVMAAAGVRELYIGLESPIDEELEAMGKGYRCIDMERWLKKLRKMFRHIHQMYIANYPLKELKSTLSADEIVKRFKKFIRKTKGDTVQVLLPGPLPKTGLRTRLQKEKRVLPLEIAPWNFYDGTLGLIIPDNMSFEEFQEIPIRIMKWFYSPLSYFRVALRTCTFLIDIPTIGWKRWHRGWLREIIKSFGSHIVRRWEQRKEKESLIQRVKNYLKERQA